MIFRSSKLLPPMSTLSQETTRESGPEKRGSKNDGKNQQKIKHAN